tara:strand:- start:10 stop:282 length:273 start_codon:yes stop_codon:yes gene_type:complete
LDLQKSPQDEIEGGLDEGLPEAGLGVEGGRALEALPGGLERGQALLSRCSASLELARVEAPRRQGLLELGSRTPGLEVGAEALGQRSCAR